MKATNNLHEALEFYPSSEAGQDLFVYRILNNKKNGTYLDIGCGEATERFNGCSAGNNTNELSRHGWTGIGIDINPAFSYTWTVIRQHPFLVTDVTTVDWNFLIKEHSLLQNHIDYLSFDVDDATTFAMRNFPFDKIRFSVITIEHDSYRVGNEVKKEMREILSKAGYQLLCSDVQVIQQGTRFLVYEDWWIDITKIDAELADKYRCHKKAGYIIT